MNELYYVAPEQPGTANNLKRRRRMQDTVQTQNDGSCYLEKTYTCNRVYRFIQPLCQKPVFHLSFNILLAPCSSPQSDDFFSLT